ncbi:MAG: response regulator, partial [Bacteroidota bacterium]
EVANNGREAVEKVEVQSYDLILMDLQMPEMDGFEATQAIRSMHDPLKSRTPIIALTASALLEVQEEVAQAGMNDFATKPFNPQDLFQKIAKNVAMRV